MKRDSLTSSNLDKIEVNKPIEIVNKSMKKSSSALHISNHSQNLKGSQSYHYLDNTSKSLKKYFKPSKPVNLKEVDWMNYAQVRLSYNFFID